jgi:DNA topoisomerase I
VLWRKLPGAKSAGRVQSVALRLIVEREREIEASAPAGILERRRADEHDGTAFEARLVKFDGEKLEKLSLGAEGMAMAPGPRSKPGASPSRGRDQAGQAQPRAAVHHLDPAAGSRAQARLFRQPHHALAQSLYEAGAITYMRTDGVQMDGSAISRLPRGHRRPFDGHYLPEKPRFYSTKAKNAQEAHEAIRPTDFTRERAGSGDEAKLYDLIFKRAMASQMATAQLERTTVTLRDPTGQHELRATGQVVKFPGFLAVYRKARRGRR